MGGMGSDDLRLIRTEDRGPTIAYTGRSQAADG